MKIIRDMKATPGVITQTIDPSHPAHPSNRGHTISMTCKGRDADGLPTHSVATCECGRWQNSVPVSEYQEQDAAVEAHWQSVLQSPQP